MKKYTFPPVISRSLGLISLSLILVASSLADDQWPSFQNGGQPGNLKSSSVLPQQWSSDTNIKWSVPLDGYGQSSPVFDGKLLYVTSVKGGMKEQCVLEAKEIGSGKTVWKKVIQNSSPEKNSTYVSRAAPTPICDQHGVIAFFEGGNLIAFTAAGDKRWELDLVKKYGAVKARHGLASSLEQDAKHVFVWVERSESPYLLAVEKQTGKVTWKSPGLGVSSWSSPRLVPVGESQHLVLSGIGKIAGYDPGSGDQLWTFDQINGNSTPTPMPVGDGLFLIGASSGRGQESSGKAADSNGLIQIEKNGGNYSARFVWKADTATSTFGSPLAYNGHAYFVNRSGVLFCLDLKTGKEVYAGRIKSSIWATPIGHGNKVYLFGRDGNTTIVDAGKSFKKVSTNSLWKSEAPKSPGEGGSSLGGNVLYSGIKAGDSLVLRRGDRLYCVRQQNE